MDICTIILAAGKSSRMKSKIPKPFHNIAGMRMIDWVLHANSSINPKRTIIIGSKSTNFDDYKHKYDIVIQEKPLGTADAVKHAVKILKNFNGIILVLYADTPFISKSSLNDLVKSIKNKNDISISSFNKEEPNSYGKIVLSKSKMPKKIIENKKLNNKIKLCNGGIIAFNAKTLISLLPKIKMNNVKSEFYLTDIIEIAFNLNIKIQHIKILEEEIMGINNKIQLSNAEIFAQNKFREKLAQTGITLLSPETIFLSYDTIIQKDSIIHPNVVIGPKVKVEKNCEILPFSFLENCIIKSGSKIGPFARIRQKTIIGKNSKIGNFVEIKNSNLRNNVKINHLSYIGDANIGKNTNIGAGTITCNYDGFNKNKTMIGYNSFVGSNSSLIAPINIGNNTTIAAGSTITENVPNNALSISRKQQKNIKNKSITLKKN